VSRKKAQATRAIQWWNSDRVPSSINLKKYRKSLLSGIEEEGEGKEKCKSAGAYAK
jgi:hypothetical protein